METHEQWDLAVGGIDELLFVILRAPHDAAYCGYDVTCFKIWR